MEELHKLFNHSTGITLITTGGEKAIKKLIDGFCPDDDTVLLTRNHTAIEEKCWVVIRGVQNDCVVIYVLPCFLETDRYGKYHYQLPFLEGRRVYARVEAHKGYRFIQTCKGRPIKPVFDLLTKRAGVPEVLPSVEEWVAQFVDKRIEQSGEIYDNFSLPIKYFRGVVSLLNTPFMVPSEPPQQDSIPQEIQQLEEAEANALEICAKKAECKNETHKKLEDLRKAIANAEWEGREKLNQLTDEQKQAKDIIKRQLQNALILESVEF